MYFDLRQREGYANRMYGRAKEDSGGRLWLQYWLYYFYNDYNLTLVAEAPAHTIPSGDGTPLHPSVLPRTRSHDQPRSAKPRRHPVTEP